MMLKIKKGIRFHRKTLTTLAQTNNLKAHATTMIKMSLSLHKSLNSKLKVSVQVLVAKMLISTKRIVLTLFKL